jgi:penicillin-binding protein A
VNAQIRRVGVTLMLLFGALFLQLNWLQVVRAEKLANDPRNTRVAVRDFSRPRGVIQTADGVILARSVPSNDSFERQREYPEKELFAHVTGYFSFTYGSDGIERSYNDELAGRDLPLRLRKLSEVLVDRTQTANVTVTLNKRLQEVARNELGNRRGSIVAIDPRSGALLALWSFPSFDPNPLAGHDQKAVRSTWDLLNLDRNKPLLARAYKDRFSPGSTFKVVTAAAALERRPDLAANSYPVLRDLDLPQTNRNLPNFGGGSCGGTLVDLLKVSCNTGFAQMGLDMGAAELAAEAGDFGFNERPPIDLPAPARSVFPAAEEFERNLPALAQSAIGQRDVAASPLQMALVAAGVANGGSIMRPQVMFEVRDRDGEVVKRGEPQEWRRAMSPEAAAALKAMMVEVVARGTGTRAAVPGVPTAGKTGTAQTTGDNAHAWFIGFAPADQPTVAVAVIVESQPELAEATGGRVAAPIAGAVMRAALGR